MSTTKSVFKALFETQACGVSLARLWLMRLIFAVIAFLLGVRTWVTLIENYGQFEPFEGVAYAFWAALGVLALIGIRYPLQMTPVLLIQFAYKVIWLFAVGYPLEATGALDGYGANELMTAMERGAVADIVVIPWVFVAKRYLFGFFGRSGS